MLKSQIIYFSFNNNSQGGITVISNDIHRTKSLNTIMKLDGFRSIPYRVCFNEEEVIIGKGHRFNSKFDYIIIPFEDIKTIIYKDLWGKGEIKIETQDHGKYKAQGLNPYTAKVFVDQVKKILTGEEDILNFNQEILADEIPIYSTDINNSYTTFGKISVRADSSLFSKTATMDDVNARLREEAVRLNANAIINAEYERTSLTSWRGVKATGIAVYIGSDEKKCPFCAEMIKKDAIKCKHCFSDLTDVE